MSKKELSFEQSMNRLEEIVKMLERGDASLEDALKYFEEGTALIRKCNALLSSAEQKILLLNQNGDEVTGEPSDGQESME